ncbi:MAG: IS3 family transposase, partial [Gemmatimonadota bacterium]|nr:IS3 family transposase [Gemmatimonadota bacterium]
DVVPASALRAAQQRIKELERALGKKAMEIEILQAARDEAKKTPLLRRVQAMTGRKLAPICRTLGMSRACAYRESVGRPARYVRADDRIVTAQIRAVIRTRASYGARRVRALVNREFATRYNLKRIQRVMELNGWKLPRATRRRTGRAHRGLIRRDGSNERWCSDVLEIACWNGEIVQVGVALDCHDREALATVAAARDLLGSDIQQLMRQAVAARFGEGERPDAPLQWLSDNGGIYTALDTLITAERLHLVPITTPAASPQSNGMSEAFVNTLRRDYLAGADHATAAVVLAQIPAWIADYNAVAPHSALGYRSPHEYRRTQVGKDLKC